MRIFIFLSVNMTGQLKNEKSKINLDPCLKNPSPCGPGAICKNINGVAICQCPSGKTGDPYSRCCKDMKCR